MNNLKTFLVGGCYVQLKPVKNSCSQSQSLAEYYVASAILYRKVPHMLYAKYQPIGSGEEVV